MFQYSIIHINIIYDLCLCSKLSIFVLWLREFTVLHIVHNVSDSRIKISLLVSTPFSPNASLTLPFNIDYSGLRIVPLCSPSKPMPNSGFSNLKGLRNLHRNSNKYQGLSYPHLPYSINFKTLEVFLQNITHFHLFYIETTYHVEASVKL